ncbi:MAG: TonB-dependent receptor [Bacteroidetes bacterium]|nr:TonB-dependent receptor [Bacteroidota bacterium]
MKARKQWLKWKLTMCIGLVVLASSASAQQSARITGVVLDESGDPVPGSTISVYQAGKGDTARAFADVKGSFVIQNLKAGIKYDVLVKSLGYKDFVKRAFPVNASDNNSLFVRLSPSSNLLEQVVVSYGRQTRSLVSGSVAQVNTAPLQDMPVTQFAQQLQGKVAGVVVNQYSGQPGRGIGFVVRGSASFYSQNQPLFVVDGVPVTGSINNINPAEIESFSFLKDAAATSLYGSRAANGVVLVTTRHAKAGNSSVEVSSYYAVQKIPGERVPKMMNARQFATFMKQRGEDGVKYEPGYKIAADYHAAYDNPDQYGEGTNWFNLLTRTAPMSNIDVVMQSAHEHSSSLFMAGYQEQQGVLINNGTKLFTARFNHEVSAINNKLKMGVNLAPSYRVDHNNRFSTDGVGGYFERFFEASPLLSPYNPDGTYARSVASPGMVAYINPLATYNLTNDNYYTTRILGNAYLNLEVLDGLFVKTSVGVDKGAETRKYFQGGLVTSTQGQSTGTSSSVDNGSWTTEANLLYNKTIARDHNIEALAGYSVQKFSQYSNNITGLGFTSDDITYLNAATSLTGGSNGTAYSLLSTIGRLNYNYKKKYLLSVAMRRDGSSRFGTNKQWGNFPSVSAGWVVSSESFMKSIPAISFLKIRGSYGLTGNNFFPNNYDAQSTIGNYYYDFNNTVTQGQTIANVGNADLAWERNKQLDLGFDVYLFNNRISLTYDYYHKVTDGLIQQRALPTSTGFTQIISNVGALKMWGHEVTINSTNLQSGKLRWNTSLIFSMDRNLITNLVSPGFIRRNNTVSSDYYRQQVGHHLGEFYGFVFQGLYKNADDLAKSAKYQSTAANPNGLSDVGTIKVKDVNGDGTIDDVNDRTFIGDPTPKFTGGLVNKFSYGNFDLNIDMTYSVGGKILNAAKWAYQTNMDGSRVPLAAALDYWRSPENPGSGVYPRTKTGTTALGRSVNSQWIESGSFLAIKNIALGYTLPVKRVAWMNSCRVYASVQQAYIFTKYTGMNPEVNVGASDQTSGVGIDENAYPIPRTFSLGFNVSFK